MNTLPPKLQKRINATLIPIYLVLAYALITRGFPLGAIIIAGASTALYVGLTIYFCIKYKCHRQLWYCLFIVVLWTAIFFINHYII